MTPDLDTLVARVLARSGRISGRILIGVAGAPGAGKSWLATELLTALTAELGPAAVAHAPMDGFHLADAELDRLGLRDRKGTPETFDPLGYVALLRRLRRNSDTVVYAPGFERTLEQPIAGRLPIPQEARIVITEGNYLLLDGDWAPVRAILDEVWFCRTDEELRLRRLLARHVEFGKPQPAALDWMARVDTPNAKRIGVTADRADLLITLD